MKHKHIWRHVAFNYTYQREDNVYWCVICGKVKVEPVDSCRKPYYYTPSEGDKDE